MKTIIHVDHVYTNPDVYELTHGRPLHCASFDAACMVEILDRLYPTDCTHLNLVELASGEYSRYEPFMLQYLIHTSKFKTLDVIKTDFVGKSKRHFKVLDICKEPLVIPAHVSREGVNAILAPYYTLRSLIDGSTFESSLELAQAAITNATHALASGGFFIAHLGSSKALADHQKAWSKSYTSSEQKFIPYSSSLRKYGTTCTVRMKGTTPSKPKFASQTVVLDFPDTNVRTIVDKPFDFPCVSNKVYVDMFLQCGLKYNSGFCENPVFTQDRDSVHHAKTPNQAEWLVFYKP